jgi:hypothetical protein
MIVNVHLTSGTVIQFASRKDLRTVLDREDLASQWVQAWVWRHPQTFDVPWRTAEWYEVKQTGLRKGSIESVVSAETEARDERDLPAKAAAEQRARQWEQREASDEPAPAAA